MAVQIYEDEQDKQIIKSIGFKFPVFYDGEFTNRIIRHKEKTVETIVGLQRTLWEVFCLTRATEKHQRKSSVLSFNRIKERARPFIFKKIESKRTFFDIKKHPFKVEMDMKSYQDIDGIAI